jgi:hypothetical protein
MALTVDFSAENILGAPGDLLFTDLSTGTDGTITQRRIYIAKWDGSFLVIEGTATDYEVWSGFPGTTTITLEDILDKDYAVIVTVQWLTAGGTVVYDKVRNYGFPEYNEEFDYSLTEMLSGNPLLINDQNFYTSKSDLRTDIDSGNKAIERWSDIYAAQQCYDRATQLRTNSQYYYNEAV